MSKAPEVSEENREQTEMQPAMPEEEETASIVSEAEGDAPIEDGGEVEGQSTAGNSNFGETMNVLKMNSTDITLLRTSFDLLLHAMCNDREAVGDAIYGTKIGALVAIKDSFTTPRAVVSLRFFNCFRLLLEKAFAKRDYREACGFRDRRLSGIVDAKRAQTSPWVSCCLAYDVELLRLLLQVCGR